MTTTETFAPDQAVVIDLGIATKQGFFVGAAPEKDGFLTVRYETAKGEVFKNVRAEKVTALVADGEAVDEIPVDDVPIRDVDDDTTKEPAPAPKKTAKAGPKRAALPEGYVTPVGLAKVINERGLYTGTREDGLSSQMLYGYIKQAAGTDRAFPGEEINGRLVVEVEAGVRWWTAKNERGAARRVAAKVDRHELAAELNTALAAEDPIAAVRAIAERLAS